MEHKRLAGLTVKNADLGELSAVFATFDVVDHDRDVVVKGAIPDGREVVISAYNHASWGPGAIPIGKGVVRTTDTEAILDGRLFMDTAAGRETFAALKELGHLAEYSWGFDIIDAEPGDFGGQKVRYIKRVDLHEVSPVLKGASIGTRTLAVKSASGKQSGRPVATHDTEVVTRAWDAAAVVAALPADPRPSELRSVYAWVDPAGDVEAIGSYRIPHHHGINGPANLRACIAGIATLNKAGGDIPEADRKAVYDHLATHVREADREPLELRAGTGIMKLNDRAALVLADLSGLVDSTIEVGASRAEKGKGLGKFTTEILGWVADEVDRLKARLADPMLAAEEPLRDEEISTIVRAIALTQGIGEAP